MKGAKSREMDDVYKLLYYETLNGRNGVAIAVSKRFCDNISHVQRKNEWFMAVKIQKVEQRAWTLLMPLKLNAATVAKINSGWIWNGQD